MKRIEITQLVLVNFKGIKHLLIDFEKETQIRGDNATGKTTVFDAFLWLLFGKDSFDRKDFNIKTLDENGIAIPQIDHEVIGKLKIIEQDLPEMEPTVRTVILKRTLREKWVKPRGQAEEEFKGHETLYNINSVPMTMAEYAKEIEAICPENLFKLLTNPAFFPSQNWTLQRTVLMGLIGKVSIDDILDNIEDDNHPFSTDMRKFLLDLVNAAQDMAKIREKIGAEKKRIKALLLEIPGRIDEAKRSAQPLPEGVTLKDGPAILNDTEEHKNAIQMIDKEIMDASIGVQKANEGRTAMVGELAKANSAIAAAERKEEDAFLTKYLDENRDRQQAERTRKETEDEIDRLNRRKAGYVLDLEDLRGKKQNLLNEWQQINAETFSYSGDGICSQCGQPYPEAMLNEAKSKGLQRFNESKKGRLDTNISKGKAIAAQITALEKTIQDIDADIEADNKILAGLPEWSGVVVASKEHQLADHMDKWRSTNQAYRELIIARDEMNAKLMNTDPQTIDTTDLQNLRQEHEEAIRRNDSLLSIIASHERSIARADELKKQKDDLSQLLADQENMEYVIIRYQTTESRLLEAQVNNMFRMVRFKLFDIQINGQIVDTCECTVGGVPYSDLNNAARINAGIDIIDTLSSHNETVAPIFIDNAESVNDIMRTKYAQFILLYVTKDKQLTIK